jgi:hypothetical protein
LKLRKTATGPDEIPFWVWKENADVFAPVMTKIWNESLSTSTWPTSWKIAHIDPLPKVKNPKEYCEFRGTYKRHTCDWTMLRKNGLSLS